MRRILLVLLVSFNYSFSQCEIRFMDLVTASKFINKQDFDILNSIAIRNNFNYDSIQDKFICEYYNEVKLSKLNADRTYLKYEFQNKGELNNKIELFKFYGKYYKSENSENSKTDIYFILENKYIVYVNTLIINDTKSKDFLKEKYTILIGFQE